MIQSRSALWVVLAAAFAGALEAATAQAILTGPGSTAVTQPAAPQRTHGPVIHVDNVEHDFGVVWVGTNDALTHAFTISNRGSTNLEIRGVRVQCGCTTAGDHPRVLEPGKSAQIPITLRTQGLNGRIAPKNIYIDSNDPATPSLNLRLVGTFKSRIEVSPAVAGFGVVLTDQPISRTIKIKNNTDTPAEIKLRPAASEKVEFTLVETEPGKAWDLHVTTVVPYQPGPISATALLDTSVEQMKILRVSAAGRVPDRLDLSPAVMPYTKPARPTPGQDYGKVVFWLANYGASLVNVKQATVDDPALQTVVECVAPGKNYRIQVNIPLVATLPPAGRVLTIHTDDAETPTLQARIVPHGGAAANQPTTATRPAAPARPNVQTMVGKPAPIFNLATFENKKVAVDDLKGKLTLLNFISPTCPACKHQLPMLDAIREAYQSKGVRFVNVVNPDPSRRRLFSDEEIKKVLDAAKSHLEIAADHGQAAGGAFLVTSYPTAVLIDKDGTIASAVVGWKQVELLRDHLDALLAGKPVPAATRPQ